MSTVYRIRDKSGNFANSEGTFTERGKYYTSIDQVRLALEELEQVLSHFDSSPEKEGLVIIEYQPYISDLISAENVLNLNATFGRMRKEPLYIHDDEKLLSDLEEGVKIITDCLSDAGLVLSDNVDTFCLGGRYTYFLSYKDYPSVELILHFDQGISKIVWLVSNLSLIKGKERVLICNNRLLFSDWSKNDFKIPLNFVSMIVTQLEVFFSNYQNLRTDLENI